MAKSEHNARMRLPPYGLLGTVTGDTQFRICVSTKFYCHYPILFQIIYIYVLRNLSFCLDRTVLELRMTEIFALLSSGGPAVKFEQLYVDCRVCLRYVYVFCAQ